MSWHCPDCDDHHPGRFNFCPVSGARRPGAPQGMTPNIPLPDPWVWDTDDDGYYCARIDIEPSGTVTVHEASDPPGDEITIAVRSRAHRTHSAPVPVIVAVALANRRARP